MPRDEQPDREPQAGGLDRESPTQTEGPEAATEEFGASEASLVVGQNLGGRYQVLELLGRGGMGEVWRAFDLKLRVEVALKALREDLFKDERRREMLRQEVRAAREVVSPNVCRIFDLVEADGRELVSMEYVDGQTLLGVLQERGPLELKEAQDVASQFLAGLEAIHSAGLVHRDVKPENIMLTRAGRVVVMDFGLARQEAEGGGSVSGTPAYMAPEQAAGQAVDARADVYAAGVVLAEMVSPEGIRSLESRQSVWEGVRSDPAKLPDIPWTPVLKKAVAKDRERRYRSAHTLTRALEEVTLRVEGAEDLHPYPGLASFTEEDAEYFFGREAEVEQMWRKLEGPPRMLGLVGPSGAGKTSFLRAGLLPAATPTWATTVCTPGTNPVLGLSRALGAELAGDREAVDLLLRFEDPTTAIEAVERWRRSAGRAVLVVDQFEELFTQNGPEVQQRFAELLEGLVLEADVHVLLSMRDDFLFRCHEHESLKPVFSELGPLGPPIGAALRRALTQPALQCGYRFEDDELVEEMLAEVEGERGALPLLAFAAARLWEQRDRESGLLTRQAYQDIGGVGGALARHAEATIERIGADRIPIVRELFRNLVTAEGTRAVRDATELVSVFQGEGGAGVKPAPTKRVTRNGIVGPGFTPGREAAQEVLSELIDARLLTSYDVRDVDEEATRRVEIIHESLLANWPRLVRWQTQDADASQLREQLRQAAKTWDEHHRTDDLLWTGAAHREFASWRERYPGGLTDVEEAFARAMAALAARRRRRRRIAAAASVTVLLAVLAVVTGLWRRSVLETRRAEAQKLFALGQLELDSYPTAAMAWATASLELADTREARLLAVRALAKGPPVTVLDPPERAGQVATLRFSPNGEWMAGGSPRSTHLWFHDGSPARTVEELDENSWLFNLAFASNDVLITNRLGSHRWWSVSDVREPLRVEENRGGLVALRGDGYFSTRRPQGEKALYWWPLDGGPVVAAGDLPSGKCMEIGPSGTRLAFVDGNRLEIRNLDDWDEEPRLVGELDTEVSGGCHLAFAPDGAVVAAVVNGTRRLGIWPLGGEGAGLPRNVDSDDTMFLDVEFGPGGSWIVTNTLSSEGVQAYWIFDLDAPHGVEPLALRKTGLGYDNPDQVALHPGGDWLVTSDLFAVSFWPMNRRHPWVFDLCARVSDVAFTHDGRWLLSLTDGTGSGAGGAVGQLRAWPLAGQNGGEPRLLLERPKGHFYWAKLVLDPSGERVAVPSNAGQVYIVPIAGGPVRELVCADDVEIGGGNLVLSFSPDGRYLAFVPFLGPSEETPVHAWDLVTDDVRPVGTVSGTTGALRFVDARRLLWAGSTIHGIGTGGEKVFDIETGEETVVSRSGSVWAQTVSPDGSSTVTVHAEGELPTPTSTLVWDDRNSGSSKTMTTHGGLIAAATFDPSGRWIVSNAFDGTVRVGPVAGDEPHLLLGHESRGAGAALSPVAVSPDGQWIASAGEDHTVRMWPMPDLSKPPLHTLPRQELIAKVKTLTNLRVVRDEDSSTGWKVEIGPFPGWETVPTW